MPNGNQLAGSGMEQRYRVERTLEANAWGIKKMKTKWGTCNIAAKRIWLNLELAKKPIQCLEYIVVHELLHLIERHHSEHFRGLMDQHLPQWRAYRDELNGSQLGDERWGVLSLSKGRSV